MLSLPEFLLWGCVAGFLALPVIWAWRLALLYLFGAPDPPPPDAALPSVAVILPLRGADPSLHACLRGLLDQDYPQYQVRIVIDSLTDPAWDLVPEILAEGHGPHVDVRVTTLRQPCDTCTLKISAQMQAVTELDRSIDVVAMIDADAVPPRNWLRTLVAPLADPRVGGVTGVRWFAPARPTWGALVRHLWNAGSQPQMLAFSIPWGGTLALRAGLFRQDELLAEWRRSFCDDSGAGDLLRRRGLRLRFLTALTMVNCESTDLRRCCRFIHRQLLCPRLDLGHWPLILAANVGVSLALAVAAGLAAAGPPTGRPVWSAWFGGALAAHFGGLLSALFVAEHRIRDLVCRRGQELPPPILHWRSCVAAVLAYVINAGCLVRAVCVRRVAWRGVEYRVVGPKRVRLGEYRPFERAQPRAEPGRSIL
jgi:Glycosyl transferase family 21